MRETRGDATPTFGRDFRHSVDGSGDRPLWQPRRPLARSTDGYGRPFRSMPTRDGRPSATDRVPGVQKVAGTQFRDQGWHTLAPASHFLQMPKYDPFAAGI